MTRFRSLRLGIIGAAVLACVAGAGALAVASTETYAGENTCRYHVAWPNGTYLGQMHPYHVDFYARHHGQGEYGDPCSTWARDQRNSAVRGLRAMGYTVLAPQERITWNVTLFHGVSVYVRDADGDALEVASTGGVAGVSESPLLLVHHEALTSGSGERRVSAWIDGERMDWHGTGYTKGASSTWLDRLPGVLPAAHPSLPHRSPAGGRYAGPGNLPGCQRVRDTRPSGNGSRGRHGSDAPDLHHSARAPGLRDLGAGAGLADPLAVERSALDTAVDGREHRTGGPIACRNRREEVDYEPLSGGDSIEQSFQLDVE